jgi:hypothetical protein
LHHDKGCLIVVTQSNLSILRIKIVVPKNGEQNGRE